MKRLAAISLALCLAIGAAGAPVRADGPDKEPKLLYSVFFEGDSVPYTLRASGKDENNRIEMKQGRLNILSVGSGNPGIEFRTGKKVGKMVVHFELKMEKISSDVVVWMSDYDDSLARVLVFTPQGMIKGANGAALKDISTYGKEQWISLDMVINAETYSLFVNGEKICEELRLPTRSSANTPVNWTKNIKGFKIDTYNRTGLETSVSVAGIAAYEGNELFPDEALKRAGQPQEVDSDSEEEKASNVEIYANSDFNEMETGSSNTGIGGDKKKNLTYIEDFPSEEDKSIRLESVTSDTFNVLTSFDTAMKESFVWDFRVYFDDMKSKATLTLRDPKPLFFDLIVFNTGGQIRDINNRTIANYKTKTWYRVQTVVNMAEKKYSFYLDGKEIIKDCPFGEGATSIGLVRFHIYPPQGGGSVIHIDDWRVYGGSEFLDDEFLKRQGMVSGGSHFTNQQKMKTLFKQKIAAASGAPYFFANGQRMRYDGKTRAVKAFEDQDELFVPLRSVVEGIGGSVAWREKEALADYGGRTLSVRNKEKSYKLDGRDKTANAAVCTSNGRMFVPFSILADFLGGSMIANSSGLWVIELDDNKLDLQKAAEYINEMHRYLLYDRPSPQEIIERLVKRYPNNEHPRIMVEPGEFERIKALTETNDIMKGWYASLKKNADSLIDAALIQYTPATGDTLLESARSMLSRAKTLGLMYNITKEKKYKDALWRNLEMVCSFPDWYPTHFLDVGEMSMAVAIGYDWLYNDWTKEQRKIMEDALETKGLAVTLHQYETDNQTGYWVVTDNNWNVVCNGGAAVAALAIGDKNPELTGKVVHYALWGLESMMKEYAPDGGWNEGVTYWQYATSYFVQLMSALKTALGDDFGFMESAGVSNTANFAIHATGPRGIFNFHDAGNAFYNSPEILWISDRLGLPELTTNNLYTRKIYNLGGGADEIIWFNPEMNIKDGGARLPTEAAFKGIETAFMRSKFGDPNGTYVGLHGGRNNVNHGHLDIGSFILDSIGERWFLDLGGDNYSLPEYFGAKRWNYYRVRAEGHNTLVINPDSGPDQVPTASGKIIEQFSKPRGAYSVLDMTPAFAGAEDVKRGIMLADDRSMVILRDEIELKQPSELYWFAHTKADIKLSEDKKSAVLTIGNKQLYAQLASDLDAEFSVMDALPLPTSPKHDAQNKNLGVKKLAIHLNGVKKGYIQVTFLPVLIYGEEPSREIIPEPAPISEWKNMIPDGELIPFGVDKVWVDGKELEGFDTGNQVYKLKYPFGTTDIPVVTAQSGIYDVEVIQAETMPGTAKIIVKDPQNPKRVKSYLIEFIVLPQIGSRPADSVEVVPKAVTASETPQPENAPKNTIDNDLSTRWSAFGVQWIEYDLGALYDVAYIELAWLNGAKRVYPFEVYLSEDGEEYKNVLRSENSKTTDNMEIYQLPKTKARYVRVKCFGNSENEWCSLTEAKIYAKK